MKKKKSITVSLITCVVLCGFASITFAEKPSLPSPIIVSHVWAKTSIPGSAVSAAYMQIQSNQNIKLIKVETTAANMVEIHNMQMNGDVMEMNAVDAVDVPAHKMVELKPGGLHVMLMQVKQPIKNGDKVPMTLTFEGADKKLIRMKVEAIGQDKNKQK